MKKAVQEKPLVGINRIFGKKRFITKMSKIFDNAKEWNENTKDDVGLPRPFFIVDKYFRKRKNKIYLLKKTPIPWQSLAFFSKDAVPYTPNGDDTKNTQLLGLYVEKEKLVYKNHLCGYCGLKINKDENVTRWTNSKAEIQDGRVLSDSHPFHLECMRQARIFCPFMRTVAENEFEYGLYSKLRHNAEKYLKDNNILY